MAWKVKRSGGGSGGKKCRCGHSMTKKHGAYGAYFKCSKCWSWYDPKKKKWGGGK